MRERGGIHDGAAKGLLQKKPGTPFGRSRGDWPPSRIVGRVYLVETLLSTLTRSTHSTSPEAAPCPAPLNFFRRSARSDTISPGLWLEAARYRCQTVMLEDRPCRRDLLL